MLRTYQHQPYAFRKIRAQRDHAVHVVTQAQNQPAVVGGSRIINVTFNLFRPAQYFFGAYVLPGVPRPQ